MEDDQTKAEVYVKYLDQDLKITQVMQYKLCLLYTSPSPRDGATSRMPSSA